MNASVFRELREIHEQVEKLESTQIFKEALGYAVARDKEARVRGQDYTLSRNGSRCRATVEQRIPSSAYSYRISRQ